uniref:c-Myc-binding protein n=1 Tax=Dicentrarchus labrax TaxID=13489 RepID=A0A8C4FCV4_DICLA
MAHYRASESKREQFRRYLEKSGVLDTITSGTLHKQLKDIMQHVNVLIQLNPIVHLLLLLHHRFVSPAVLVALYEETDKPNNALDFIKLHLGAAGPEPADVETLRMELADLQQKCNLLMEENKELRNRVRSLEYV